MKRDDAYWKNVDAKLLGSSKSDALLTLVVMLAFLFIFTAIVVPYLSSSPKYEDGLTIEYNATIGSCIIDHTNPHGDTTSVNVTITKTMSDGTKAVVFTDTTTTFPAHIVYHVYDASSDHGVEVIVTSVTGEYHYYETINPYQMKMSFL
ncbi:MAG: hypothetical protein WC525_09565 [Candidatus Thermoplasmatota archaeon]